MNALNLINDAIVLEDTGIDLAYWREETKGPGKFQGESPLTPYLYSQSMNGHGETLSDPDKDSFHADGFTLFEEEREAFNVQESEWVLIEDSQGFVFTIPKEKFSAYKGDE
jgi:hypothetical protein